jgi:hypothetical protein
MTVSPGDTRLGLCGLLLGDGGLRADSLGGQLLPDGGLSLSPAEGRLEQAWTLKSF